MERDIFICVIIILSGGISIHALRMERDDFYAAKGWMVGKFQSTRSAWSATSDDIDKLTAFEISIHALRMERDPLPVLPHGLRRGISIHALRMERDRRYIPEIGGNSISIHALRMERDAET